MLSRLFGVTTLDVVRASTFVSEVLGDNSLSTSITVPVVGGHSGVTVCEGSLLCDMWFIFSFRSSLFSHNLLTHYPPPSLLQIMKTLWSVSSLVVMKSSKPKTALALRRSPWRMLVLNLHPRWSGRWVARRVSLLPVSSTFLLIRQEAKPWRKSLGVKV